MNAKDTEIQLLRSMKADLNRKCNQLEDDVFDAKHELEKKSKTQEDVKELTETIALRGTRGKWTW